MCFASGIPWGAIKATGTPPEAQGHGIFYRCMCLFLGRERRVSPRKWLPCSLLRWFVRLPSVLVTPIRALSASVWVDCRRVGLATNEMAETGSPYCLAYAPSDRCKLAVSSPTVAPSSLFPACSYPAMKGSALLVTVAGPERPVVSLAFRYLAGAARRRHSSPALPPTSLGAEALQSRRRCTGSTAAPVRAAMES